MRGPARKRVARAGLTAARYVWVAPTTAVGLTVGALALATGGRARTRSGTLEFYGGFATALLRGVRAGAMTLGHVVIGTCPATLDFCADHELAHVRQAERWGPAFIPAYLIASAWAAVRGRHYYYDNAFEVGARRACDEPDPRTRRARPRPSDGEVA